MKKLFILTFVCSLLGMITASAQEVRQAPTQEKTTKTDKPSKVEPKEKAPTVEGKNPVENTNQDEVVTTGNERRGKAKGHTKGKAKGKAKGHHKNKHKQGKDKKKGHQHDDDRDDDDDQEDKVKPSKPAKDNKGKKVEQPSEEQSPRRAPSKTKQ